MPTGIELRVRFALVKDYCFHLDMMLVNRNLTFDHVLHIKCLLQAYLMNLTYKVDIEVAGDDEVFETNNDNDQDDIDVAGDDEVFETNNDNDRDDIDNDFNINVDNGEDSSSEEHRTSYRLSRNYCGL